MLLKAIGCNKSNLIIHFFFSNCFLSGLDVLRILVPSSRFVEQTPIVAMKVEGPSASVNRDTKAILIPDAFVAIVFQILNVAIIRLVKITNVLILVNCLVDLELIVKSIIMWLFVDVLEDLLEIHSRY